MAKKSTISNILPLIILFLVLLILAAVGYVAWSIANDVANQTQKKMEKKNITFSKDGMKVGIKEVTREQVEDSTQNVLMKVWNNASWPAYKSKLGWGQGTANPAGSPASTPGVGTEKRKPFSRSTSTQSKRKA